MSLISESNKPSRWYLGCILFLFSLFHYWIWLNVDKNDHHFEFYSIAKQYSHILNKQYIWDFFTTTHELNDFSPISRLIVPLFLPKALSFSFGLLCLGLSAFWLNSILAFWKLRKVDRLLIVSLYLFGPQVNALYYTVLAFETLIPNAICSYFFYKSICKRSYGRLEVLLVFSALMVCVYVNYLAAFFVFIPILFNFESFFNSKRIWILFLPLIWFLHLRFSYNQEEYFYNSSLMSNQIYPFLITPAFMLFPFIQTQSFYSNFLSDPILVFSLLFGVILISSLSLTWFKSNSVELKKIILSFLFLAILSNLGLSLNYFDKISLFLCFVLLTGFTLRNFANKYLRLSILVFTLINSYNLATFSYPSKLNRNKLVTSMENCSTCKDTSFYTVGQSLWWVNYFELISSLNYSFSKIHQGEDYLVTLGMLTEKNFHPLYVFTPDGAFRIENCKNLDAGSCRKLDIFRKDKRDYDPVLKKTDKYISIDSIIEM